ncbi:hypothetical protein OGAPHI_004231 [Ogataea philodendri]|uniref:ATP-dependent bile acid permease n=1 Tax=Ogataea philodendri TaxID=1378263 RepID=A0A9P8P753_9ASCO|nr:uncharacterized protein OGAPHI_004231 [Ogataea philodendri]KAH3666042.1 hypothetical protein OGAPHI_004231 [Ogataea philodendri]
MVYLSSNSTSYCEGYWDVDDLTICGRQLIEVLILIPLALSFLSVTSNWVFVRSTKDRSESKDDPEQQSLLKSASPGYASIANATPTPNLSFIHETKAEGVINVVYRDTPEKIKLVLEQVFLLLQTALTLHSLSFIDTDSQSAYWFAKYVNLAFWSYLSVVTLIRLLNVSKGLAPERLDLWAHCVSLYTIQWLNSAMLFRSALLYHTGSSSVRNYFIAQFAINTILELIISTEKLSDKPALVFVQEDTIPSTEPTSSLLQIVSFAWIDTMVFKARSKTIELTDVLGLRLEDCSLVLISAFRQVDPSKSIIFRFAVMFKWDLLLQSFYTCCESILTVIPSLALKNILEYVRSPETASLSLAWFWIVAPFVSDILQCILSLRGEHQGRRVSARMRSILTGEIYAKALKRKLSAAEKKDELTKEEEEIGDSEEDSSTARDIGGIINLMAVDTSKSSEIGGNLNAVTRTVIMTTTAIYLLFHLLGWSSVVGLLALLATMPITYKISSLFAKTQEKLLAITDKRVQKLNETLQNIRVVKYFSWEDRFSDIILKIRKDELKALLRLDIIWCFSDFTWSVTPSVVSFATFYWYNYVQGNQLTTPVAFTALSLLNLLRGPIEHLAHLASVVIQSKVSLDRIGSFLNESETSKYEQLSVPRGPDSPLVGFENATFYWSKNSESEFALRDLNISFKTGKLNVIIGPTGSGKTSLLLALLGEMDLDKGKVFLPGITSKEDLIPNPLTGLTESVAYCAQSAWLLNATIKENILFGSHYNEERFKAVIHDCGLTRDLEIFDDAEETEIGEKGITISGGQKQRISLARAIYSSASYLLLDDCLSAVDSHTAVHIYEHCIKGSLMKNRTCLLVSHNVSLTVQEAENVILMENGRVKAQGDIDELNGKGLLGEGFMKSITQSRNVSSSNLEDEAAKAIEHVDENLEEIKEQKPRSKLVKDETKAEGAVKLSVYYSYFKNFGTIPFYIVLAFAFAAVQVANIGQSYWLRYWAGKEDHESPAAVLAALVPATYTDGDKLKSSLTAFVHNLIWGTPVITTAFESVGANLDGHGPMYYLGIYAFIGFLYAGLLAFRYFLCLLGGLRMSKSTFSKLLDNILHAKLRFFDQTPIGRIMNRFSKDIEAIDQGIIPSADEFLHCVIACAVVLIMICLITPAFLVIAAILIVVYTIIGTLFVTLSRDLKRIESVTKSPIHQQFSETLAGMITIRAYGDQRRFLRQNLEQIDTNNRPLLYIWICNMWLGFRAHMIGATITFFASVFTILNAANLDAGLAGISLSLAATFRLSSVYLVECHSHVEMEMNGVERVQEYVDGVDKEPPMELPQDPVNSWPSKGEIDVRNISIKYAPDLPRVIDGVSFHVNSGEKVGVVGRTGAGKSTIITSFFRFVDLDSGSITIDGLDISKLGLKTLRKGLSIIPQDPTLFTGTIRSNLDMFDEYSNLQMYESLRRVNLISNDDYQQAVENNGGRVEDSAAATDENVNRFLNLDSEVTEGGENLSQGERQLLCLARSILKTPKILMLDEATASIDYASDAKIQTTIREEFSASTILTIAHRLKTIIDYDKILLLDHGKVKEFEHPYNLITNSKTEFHKMCQDTGEYEELVNLARQAYKKSR